MRIVASAKLTLTLRVLGRRADGFHDLDALMVTVTEPHDILEIEPASETSLVVSGPFADGVPVDGSNLAWRALDAIGVRAAVHLEKGIPPSGGLGGGSADAAAVLRAFDGDRSIAASLGADVAFCLHGGAARVRGIGDAIEAVDQPGIAVLIATPRFSCATAAVYAAWDDLGGPHEGQNELERAAERVEPRLHEFKRTVEAAAGAPAVLAGSGSSYAVVFADASAAEDARARVSEAIEGWTWVGTAPAAP
jgi:4-diphosphocytidyl-2-C-methyl-D-erythritol kinase